MNKLTNQEIEDLYKNIAYSNGLDLTKKVVKLMEHKYELTVRGLVEIIEINSENLKVLKTSLQNIKTTLKIDE